MLPTNVSLLLTLALVAQLVHCLLASGTIRLLRLDGNRLVFLYLGTKGVIDLCKPLPPLSQRSAPIELPYFSPESSLY